MRNTARFFYRSTIFRYSLVTTVGIILLMFIYRYYFDIVWNTDSYIPANNLYRVYAPPIAYDDYIRINIKLTGSDLVAIEGNKRLKIEGHEHNFDYYDTVKISMPADGETEKLNKIFFVLEGSPFRDSLYIMTTVSVDNTIYWKQVFLSSVFVSELNRFSEYPEKFRLNSKMFVSDNELRDNDTLINEALQYFNIHSDTMKLKECGYNSELFKTVCDRFNLPCRVIGLQGGDAGNPGYDSQIGYPMHAVCEVYSSRMQKWYVIDPTYGLRFSDERTSNYLNAVEVSHRFFFNLESEIIQDSIMFTKRTLVGRDYYKYYENVFFNRHYLANSWIKRISKYFYSRGDNYIWQFSNNLPPRKNYYYYFGIKSFGYLLLITLHLNIIIFFIIKRLYKIKIQEKRLNDRKNINRRQKGKKEERYSVRSTS